MSPYRNSSNIWVDPSVNVLNFSDGVASSENIVPNLKLKGFRIAQGTTGGTIQILENNTEVLRYFLSATQDVQLNHRPAIGGFFDLQFLNNKHNFTVKTNEMSEDDLATGKTIDLTQEITDFKTLHGVSQDFYIYFFSPFVKVGSTNTNFKVKFDLNNNELSDDIVKKTKEQLQDELDTTSWKVIENDHQNIFDISYDSFWKNELMKFGGEYQIWANAPENPNLN